MPRVTYSQPEVASVGLSEAQAKDRYGDARVKTFNYDLAGNGKSKILKTAGEVKVVQQADGPVVGIHMVGDRMGELVGEAQLIFNWEALPQEVAPARTRAPVADRGARRGHDGPGRQAAPRPRLISLLYMSHRCGPRLRNR